MNGWQSVGKALRCLYLLNKITQTEQSILFYKPLACEFELKCLTAYKLFLGLFSISNTFLFYAGGEGEEDSPTEEQYAICVTKGNTALLDAINAVLDEMMKSGEIEKLVMQHMGFEG